VFRAIQWRARGRSRITCRLVHTGLRRSSTCPESAILRVFATEKNVEEKSTLMWIVLYGVCGAQAVAMDARIIRDEEGINSVPRSKTAFLSLCSTSESLTITNLFSHIHTLQITSKWHTKENFLSTRDSSPDTIKKEKLSSKRLMRLAHGMAASSAALLASLSATQPRLRQ